MEKHEKKLQVLEKRQQEPEPIFEPEATAISGARKNTATSHPELRLHQLELELKHGKLKRVQKELLKYRKKYVRLYDNVPFGFVTLGSNQLILQTNLTFTSLVQQERQQLINKDFSSLIIPSHRKLFQKYLESQQQSMGHRSVELQLESKNSREIWLKISSLENSIIPVKNSNYSLVVIDITSQKEAEKHQNRIVNLSHDLICSIGSDGFFKFANPAFKKTLGYKINEVIDKSFKEFIFPQDYTDTFSQLQRVQNNPHSIDFENRCVHKNGQLKTISWRTIAMPTENMIYAIGRDITEQKKMTDDLIESEKRFRTLTALSPAGIFLTAPNGHFLYTNQCWSDMSGCPQESAKGEGWLQSVDYRDKNRVEQAWKRMIQTREPFSLEYRFATPRGNTTWVYGLAKPLQNPPDGPGGFIGVNTNITTMKQAELKLQNAVADLEKLVRKRSIDLAIAKRQHEEEIEKRMKVEKRLHQGEENLRKEKANLEEIKIALKVLLKKGEEERGELEEQMLINIRQLVLPYVERLKKDRLTSKQKSNIDFVEANLKKLASPFLRNISAMSLGLTPREIRVAHLVKEGNTSKEIAKTLNLSLDTVNAHRKNIRKKCGINCKNKNLRSMLLSLDGN